MTTDLQKLLEEARERWDNLQKTADELRLETERSSARLHTALMCVYTRQRWVSPQRIATLQEELTSVQRRYREIQEAADATLWEADMISAQIDRATS